jgi:hypothetical protein
VPTITTTVGRAPAASETKAPSVPATMVLTMFRNIVVLPRLWLATGRVPIAISLRLAAASTTLPE